MATSVPIDHAAVFVGASETEIGQAPSGKEWHVPVVRFCNTDVEPITLSIYITGAAQSITDVLAEYKDVSLAGKDTLEYGPVILPALKKIKAVASVAAKISAHVQGWERTP